MKNLLLRARDSKFDIERCVAGWTINASSAWLSLHSQLAFTTRACDFHLGNMGCEGEVVHAGGTLEVGRALVDSNNENFTTFWTTDFFFFPFLASDGVIDSNIRRTKGALHLTKSAWQQALAFWATERRGGHTRFNC